MILLKSIFIIAFLIVPINVYSEEEKKSISEVSTLSNTIDKVWDDKITPLTAVVGKQWASLLSSAEINTNELGKAVKETWSKAVEESQVDDEISNASATISRFIMSEVDDTKQTASNSSKLINDGKLLNGLWYLSTHIIKNTDNNLAIAVQESKLINTLAKITATSYAGPQGAAAYASWYAYKETKNPETALKVGIMSGVNNAGFSPISDPVSISQLLKNNIITGVMAGLSAAVGGGDANSVKEAFLKVTETGLVNDLSVVNAAKDPVIEKSMETKKIEIIQKITTF